MSYNIKTPSIPYDYSAITLAKVDNEYTYSESDGMLAFDHIRLFEYANIKLKYEKTDCAFGCKAYAKEYIAPMLKDDILDNIMTAKYYHDCGYTASDIKGMTWEKRTELKDKMSMQYAFNDEYPDFIYADSAVIYDDEKILVSSTAINLVTDIVVNDCTAANGKTDEIHLQAVYHVKTNMHPRGYIIPEVRKMLGITKYFHHGADDYVANMLDKLVLLSVLASAGDRSDIFEKINKILSNFSLPTIMPLDNANLSIIKEIIPATRLQSLFEILDSDEKALYTALFSPEIQIVNHEGDLYSTVKRTEPYSL